MSWRSLILVAVLALMSSLAHADPVLVTLQTEPADVEVYLLTTSTQEKGVFLGRSGEPIVFEQRYLKDRGSLDLRLHKTGYHSVTYNLKVLAIQEGSTLPREGPIRLPSEEVGSLGLMAGLGLIASLGIALAFSNQPRASLPTQEPESHASLSIDPFLGREVCGYKIVKLVAKGGMGSLYYARAEGIEKAEAAIKVVDMHGRSEHLKERFYRELAVASKLHHPAIVRTWDYEVLEERFLAISMEWLPGRPLSYHMREGLSPKECLQLLGQVFEGLAFLHQKGITHRDIKPGNIFVLPDRSCKIIDFGLAKDAGQKTITQAGTMLGTPKYMAPEQIQSEGKCQAGVDQYALGLIVYEIVAGRAPFRTDDPMMLLYHHLEEDPSLACEVNPEVTLQFARALSRMIDRDPGRRYPDMLAALQALREAS